jgi:competence protein ComEA
VKRIDVETTKGAHMKHNLLSRILGATICLLLAAGLAFSQTAGQTKAPAKTPPPAEKAPAKTKAPLIDLNSATKDQLMTLPGIDAATAQKIIDGRPFTSKAQLTSKKIISKDVYGKISPLVIAKQAPKAPAAKAPAKTK